MNQSRCRLVRELMWAILWFSGPLKSAGEGDRAINCSVCSKRYQVIDNLHVIRRVTARGDLCCGWPSNCSTFREKNASPKNQPNDRKTHNVIRQGQAVSRRRGNPATTLSALMAVSAIASGWRLSVRPSICLSGRYF